MVRNWGSPGVLWRILGTVWRAVGSIPGTVGSKSFRRINLMSIDINIKPWIYFDRNKSTWSPGRSIRVLGMRGWVKQSRIKMLWFLIGAFRKRFHFVFETHTVGRSVKAIASIERAVDIIGISYRAILIECSVSINIFKRRFVRTISNGMVWRRISVRFDIIMRIKQLTIVERHRSRNPSSTLVLAGSENKSETFK